MHRQNEYTLNIRAYTYWKNITRFILPVDQYESWAFFIVEEGTFQYSINGVGGQASTGDIVACPPNTDFHREIVTGCLSFHFVLFNWREARSQMEKDIISKLSSIPLQKFSIQESNRLASTLTHLRKTDRSRVTDTLTKLREHLLNDLWLLYYLEVQRGHQIRKEDAVMAEVKRIIEKNAFGRLILMHIAEQLHLNKVHLTRRFRQCYGITPMNYLTELRMKKAKLLLTNSDNTLEKIAHACGYDNEFYFSRVFVKHVGMAPSQYRKVYLV